MPWVTTFRMRALVLAGTLAVAGHASAAPALVYVAHATKTPPTIDGRVDDACWRQATWAGLFSVFGGEVPTAYPTAFAVCYSASHFYLAARCTEPQVDKLLVRFRGHDQAVWEDDAIEIFLGPLHDRNTYYQFCVNAAGARFERSGAAMGWNAEWVAAGHVGKTCWTVEMALPWRELGIPPAREGQWMDLNVCRDRQDGPRRGSPKKREWSAWAPMRDSFHRPELFGHLYLGDAHGSLPPMSALQVMSRQQTPDGPRLRQVRVFQRTGMVEVYTYKALADIVLDPETSPVARALGRVRKALAEPRLPDAVRRRFRAPVDQAVGELTRLRTQSRAELFDGPDWEHTRRAVQGLCKRLDEIEWEIKFALLFPE